MTDVFPAPLLPPLHREPQPYVEKGRLVDPFTGPSGNCDLGDEVWFDEDVADGIVGGYVQERKLRNKILDAMHLPAKRLREDEAVWTDICSQALWYHYDQARARQTPYIKESVDLHNAIVKKLREVWRLMERSNELDLAWSPEFNAGTMKVRYAVSRHLIERALEHEPDVVRAWWDKIKNHSVFQPLPSYDFAETFQSFIAAAEECAGTSGRDRHRPPGQSLLPRKVIQQLAAIYGSATGRDPREVRERSASKRGPFFEFVVAFLEAVGVLTLTNDEPRRSTQTKALTPAQIEDEIRTGLAQWQPT